MKPVLLIDFGSTYTKVTAVDVEGEVLLGTAASYTTVETDIGEGLQNAIHQLEAQTGSLNIEERYACSSAAGGLRMITSGLVPELTAEAARLACLGAGAKVIGVYSYELTEEDVQNIQAARPDIMLLTGGTDGGNSACILHNAEALSKIDPICPIVVAGNRSASSKCAQLLEGWQVKICENVMPRFGAINIEPTQETIRSIFLDRIIQAKGLSQAMELISGIMMPTPAAMLAAMKLLANGTETERGIGDLIAVDLGGATTDVYSICDGAPTRLNTILKGLVEPRNKRTVEGDIGMRYSIHGIADAGGIPRIARMAGIDEDRTSELIDFLGSHTDTLPDTDELRNLDGALASVAVETAVRRHAGRLEQVFTPMGEAFAQTGKDLSLVHRIIMTGGAIIHSDRVGEIARFAMQDRSDPYALMPAEAEVLVDRRYILAGMGLLSEHYPDIALRIMKRELSKA